MRKKNVERVKAMPVTNKNALVESLKNEFEIILIKCVTEKGT